MRRDAMPPEAIEARAGAPPGEPDPPRWVIVRAILAPGPRPMRAWLVDRREAGAITRHVDTDRLLPATDPFGRQVMIGQGTFRASLLLAPVDRLRRFLAAHRALVPTRRARDAA